MVLVYPGHAPIEPFLEAFAFVDRPRMEDDLHSPSPDQHYPKVRIRE